MMAGAEMQDSLDVLRPRCRKWILRTGHDKFFFAQTSRGTAQQFFKLRLAVFCVGAHVAEVTGKFRTHGKLTVAVWIHRAVQRNGKPDSIFGLQVVKQGTPGKTEIDIEPGKVTWKEVSGRARAPQMADRDRCIDVVEGFDPVFGIQHLVQCGNPVRYVGTDDGDVGIAQLGAHLEPNILPAFKDPDLAVRRSRQIAIAPIPFLVALKKNNAVTTAMQRLAQGAKCGGMPVAPGGSDGESEDGDFHKPALELGPPAVSSSWSAPDRLTAMDSK